MINNIVLVHGAWADGSGWEEVYNILIEKGFNVTIVPNPNTSLADDVKITKTILSLQNGPTVLVGHSYAWKTKKSWYIVATEDKMIPPDAERGMAKRANAEVTEIKSSHAVYISHGAEVAKIIEKAAKEA